MIHSPRKPSSKQYLLQLGAFIVDKNLNRVRDEVSTLGYFTHIKEINRELDSYCPIVGENLNEDEAKALIVKLNSGGF
jgi:cell division septation protein DedD